MKENPYLMRALYIILVPMVLLIILLNSGWLQRFIPAADVGGESLTVVRYNYYYYDYQTAFLHEHEAELAELGLDPDKDFGKQDYDAGTTWKEYFQREAEADMAETAYYLSLAEEAGYVFSEDELLPVSERIAENAAHGQESGISTKNYYIAYYGPGMTEDRYTEELTRVVKAQAYKAHLIETGQVTGEDVQAYLAENPGEAYSAVSIRVITVDALPDRATGQVGEAQLTALEAKLEALEGRYADGVSFEELQSAFSTCSVGGKYGVMTAAKSDGLCSGLTELLLEGQEALTAGQTFRYVDSESGVGYFIVFDGFAGDGRSVDAQRFLSARNIQAREDEALRGSWSVERKGFGMLLAAS